MRPVNLIPDDQRRARDGASRTGPLAYVVVGALFALLAGVAMLVLSSNQISERKDEIASLSVRKAAASARAEQLAPYTNFKLVADQRTRTIVSLADSRFDWPRVIRQLSIVIPPRLWLTSLIASAGGGSGAESEGEGGGESGAAGGITGPSLSVKGCAPGQDAVAALVASLRQIDGVTRIGLEKSDLTDGEEVEAACAQPNPFSFSLIIAFDAAPPSPDGAQAIAEVPAGEEEAGAPAESSETASTEATPAG
jgi:Tfp pilus assembly protein PilN